MRWHSKPRGHAPSLHKFRSPQKRDSHWPMRRLTTSRRTLADPVLLAPSEGESNGMKGILALSAIVIVTGFTAGCAQETADSRRRTIDTGSHQQPDADASGGLLYPGYKLAAGDRTREGRRAPSA